MTNTLKIDATEISVTASDGRTYFNTSEGLFHATDQISGSTTISNLTSGTRRKETRVLSAISPHATHVVGGAKTNYGGPSWGMGSSGYFNVGGTYVHIQTSGADNGNIRPYFNLQDWQMFTFIAGGGQLKLLEDSYSQSGGTGATTYLGFTLTYSIYAGLFT